MTASFGLPATMPSNSVKQEEGDSSSDDDDNFGPQPVKPGAGASGGHIKKEKEEEAESLDSVARRLKVPISHAVELGGKNTTNSNSTSSHGKQGGGAVLCLSSEPSGSRLVAGYRDGTVKLFDFGGMDQDLAPFKVVSPGDNGQGARVVSHSSSGDRVFVSVSSAQGLLLSREGEALAKCIRGDMYLADLSNTKGHTSEVLCAQWHPTAANIVLTGGYDGTLRVWDVTSNLYLNMLTNKSVLKVRSHSGGSKVRVPVNSCCYSSDGGMIVAGCADGSVHIWDAKILSRTKAVLRCPDSSSSSSSSGGGGTDNDDSSVTYVTVLPPSQAGGREVLVAKTQGGNVYFWELRGAHIPGCKPFLHCGGCPNDSPGANVAFSADGSLMAVTSSSSHDNKKRPPTLHFFATHQLRQQQQKEKNESSEPLRPLLAIGLTGAHDVGAQAAGPVLWQGNTNQIFVSMSSGAIKSFYDPSVSTKGVLLSVNKAPPRSKSNSAVDFSNGCVGEIYTPHALPMFKDDFASKMKGQGEKSVASKARAPDNSHLLAKSAQQQQLAAVPVVSQVTKYIVSGHKVENLRAEDPREALLKMAEKAKDGMYMGGAYGKTQPTTILAAKTIEQEQEEQERETKRQRKG
jgi:WD40 repeat protein